MAEATYPFEGGIGPEDPDPYPESCVMPAVLAPEKASLLAPAMERAETDPMSTEGEAPQQESKAEDAEVVQDEDPTPAAPPPVCDSSYYPHEGGGYPLE